MTLPALPAVQRASAAHQRPPRRTGLLLVLTCGLTALAAVAGGTAALALAAAAVVTLAVAAADAMRVQWHATQPADRRPAADAAPGALATDALTVQLRHLYDLHVEEMNLALEEGREDLARELADSYTDRALVLLTRG